MALTPGGFEDYDPRARDVPAWAPEEFGAHIGEEIGVSDWIEVTQEAVDAFAVSTHDVNFVHVNPERTRAETPLPGTIAHGFYTLSLLSQFGYQVMPAVKGATLGLNYGVDAVRMITPVPVGSRVRGRLALATAERRGETGFVVGYDVIVEIEGQEVANGGRPALKARWLTHASLGA
ncbi:MaoC family dehydratase [Rhodovulum sp. DZ06]|uniref:MaoC family dehydratase n=1 Tax=Rhodovulum sp. DZ06 TaxID=3425126 RepID=UPI003D356E6D